MMAQGKPLHNALPKNESQKLHIQTLQLYPQEEKAEFALYQYTQLFTSFCLPK